MNSLRLFIKNTNLVLRDGIEICLIHSCAKQLFDPNKIKVFYSSIVNLCSEILINNINNIVILTVNIKGQVNI